MINFINQNYNIPFFKVQTVTRPLTARPSFCAAPPKDTFEKTSDKPVLTREQEVLAKLNKHRAETNQLQLSQQTLREIAHFFEDRKGNPAPRYRRQGQCAFVQSVRKFLLNGLSTKNSFKLALLEQSMTAAIPDIAKKTGFLDIYKEDEPYKIEVAFVKFLGILYTNEGQEAVDSFLRKGLHRELYTTDSKKLTKIAEEYFKYCKKGGGKFAIKTKQNPNGKYTAVAYVDGKVRGSKTNITEESAKSRLLRSILDTEGMQPTEADRMPCQIPDIYENNPTAKKHAEDLLKSLGIINENDSLDFEQDKDLITELSIVCNPAEVDLNYYFFNRLEFMGDAITNNLASKFILEKGLDRKEVVALYIDLISNTTLKDYAKALNLKEYLNTDNIRQTKNITADMLEALTAVLYKHFSEEVVYSRLKPLFEKRYQTIQKETPNYADKY